MSARTQHNWPTLLTNLGGRAFFREELSGVGVGGQTRNQAVVAPELAFVGDLQLASLGDRFLIALRDDFMSFGEAA